MKLQADAPSAHAIHGYGPGWIRVGAKKFTSSVIVSSTGACVAWDCAKLEDLNVQHFEQFTTMDVELVIFGSGERLVFPPARCLQVLHKNRIGMETMDTQAACRAYNFLVGEGRKVAAALLL